jgi:prepilin-type processing-associated H-X9-DG protein/prepilin-type N-terminal cleavage/methylation domain-containing protein
MKQRAAFSLLELIVVISILALMVGMVTSAVQNARMSAARLQCQNNLKQIVLALHSYQTGVGRFPPGLSYEKGRSRQPYMTWLARILPQMEQSTLWFETEAAYNENRNFLANPPHIHLGRPMPTFSCPLDTRNTVGQRLGGNRVVGLTSFLGIAGTNTFYQEGVLFLDSDIRISDIADGASSTLLVGERPASANRILGWWYAGMGQNSNGEGECDSVMGMRTKNVDRQSASCPIGPYDFQPGKIANQCDAFHFWSLHSGGANFAFADGSVRFLRYSANDILPALGTRAGGETAVVPD